MNVNNVRVAPKLGVAIVGLLILMLLANLWVRSNTEKELLQSREEIERIDYKIAQAQHLRGAAMTGLEVGISQFATNENRLQIELEKRLLQQRDKVTEALQGMERLLESEQDRALFAKVLVVRDEMQALRAQAEETLDLDNYNARADFAFGAYEKMGKKYSQAFDVFVGAQRAQLEVVKALADERRQNNALVGWVITVVLLLTGVGLARWLVLGITRPLYQAVAVTQAIGEGKLTIEVSTDRKDEFGDLLGALASMAQRLRTVVTEVRTGVDAVSSAAGQIAMGNQDLSARTEQSAASLQQTAASIEQMTVTVNQSADTSQQANQLASTAVQAAERGGEVVASVVQSMEEINASSRKIADIIGVIDGIAFQTNILALNAAVEAARAGEQGRGFAVVAGEVRSLAGRSAEAAKEIKSLINTSVNNVQIGAEQVSRAGENMHEIVSSVRRVTDLIAEITAAAKEQHSAFGQVNQAVSALDEMTQQNAALVEESSAAANAMHDQSQRLMEVVSMFDVGHMAAVHSRATQVVPATVSVTAKVAKLAPAVPSAASQTLKEPAAGGSALQKTKLGHDRAQQGEWESF